MGEFAIGQSVSRFEDPRLLRGGGRYVSDIVLPGMTFGHVLRSPHAHARIRSIDTSRAKAAPGVLAVLTGADWQASGWGDLPVPDGLKRRDGSSFRPPYPALVTDRVRWAGDYVAFVVAETLVQAQDAAELIMVDYEALPAVVSTAQAAAEGAPRVWDECPDNVSNIFEKGNKFAADAAFARAARIIKRRYVITRVHAQYMETRGALGVYDEGDERYTLYTDCQYPHRVRNMLCNAVFRIPESKMRVVSGDIGGAFGSKGWQYVEHRLVLWASRKLRRPIKWTCDRSEAVLADEHGRDSVGEIELALDSDNKFLGLRVHLIGNIGAYVGSDRNLLVPSMMIGTAVGVYDIPSAYALVTGVLSNTSPTAPYRGAGRPEAIYLIERLIDDAARELSIDPLELRRRNIIPAKAMPYQNALGCYYDCGDFPTSMDMALAAADHNGFPVRREQSRARGMLRGIGLANAIEQAASPAQSEFAEIRFDTSGSAQLLIGTKNQGQGHETTFKQILHERLGTDGDTDQVAFGMGTNGSRSTVVGGSAIYLAADKIIEKGKRIAAHLLEAQAADLEFADGRFTIVGTDRALSLKEIAAASFVPMRLPPGFDGGLYESATYAPSKDTYPNGCHVCEVEIDPETGDVAILNYVIIDDVGTVVNPLTLKGQIHGGIAQGLGQILMERVVYDDESGQLVTASFMDYAMPRADVFSHVVPMLARAQAARSPSGCRRS